MFVVDFSADSITSILDFLAERCCLDSLFSTMDSSPCNVRFGAAFQPSLQQLQNKVNNMNRPSKSDLFFPCQL